jgi:ribosomal protein S12 methylthiotransferase accessory factor
MSSEMIVTFPGGKRVDASFGGFTIRTDQPPQAGGDGSAPTPYATFLASLATCAGIFVLGFCQQRGIPTEGVRVVQRLEMAPGGGISAIDIAVEVPPSFPEKYLKAVAAAANACSVKKTIHDPPEFRVNTVVK